MKNSKSLFLSVRTSRNCQFYTPWSLQTIDRLQQLDEDVLERANQYIRDNPHRVQCNDPLIDISRWRRTLFSPNGHFLAVIQSRDVAEYEETDETEYIDSSVIVYWNKNSSTRSDGWTKIGERGPFLELGGVKDCVLFDPIVACLVLIADRKRYFWRFLQSSQNSQVYEDLDITQNEVHIGDTSKEYQPLVADTITSLHRAQGPHDISLF
jgi:hypothetical protein